MFSGQFCLIFGKIIKMIILDLILFQCDKPSMVSLVWLKFFKIAFQNSFGWIGSQ